MAKLGQRDRGFTLVELIVVIVIVGIVALIAAPRFFTASTFDAARFHDAAITAIRYAQKVAVAQHTNIYVITSASSVALCYDAACATPVPRPADGAPYTLAAPSGIGITAASFSFNALGQPNPNTTQQLSITGDIARQITIERETGHVHK